MSARVIFMTILVTIIFAGCSQNLTNGYFWGNYSKTQYSYLKNPNMDTLQAHVESLEKIVSVSNNRKLRIPPGILIELAMMRRIQDPHADINNYLNQELAIYPESARFIQFVNTNLFVSQEGEEHEQE